MYSMSAAEVPKALLFLLLMVAAQAIVLLFEVRRHSVSVTIGEIPLLLALFHLSPLAVIIIRAVACAVVQVVQRQSLIKALFNIVAVSLAATVAAAIVVGFPIDQRSLDGSGALRTWLVLAVAVAASSVISLAAVIGVICLVQGIPPLRSLTR